MSDAEKIAEVLAAHQSFCWGPQVHCHCGWVKAARSDYGRDEHRAHQAKMVAAALEPAIREGEAW